MAGSASPAGGGAASGAGGFSSGQKGGFDVGLNRSYDLGRSGAAFSILDLGNVEGYWSMAVPPVVDTTLGVNSVASWADQSGHGRTWQNAVKAQQPVYQANGIAPGFAYIAFTAANSHYLRLSSDAVLTGDFTILQVMRTSADSQTVSDGALNIQIRANGSVTPSYMQEYMNGNGVAQSSNLGTHISGWSCLGWQRSGGTAYFWQNGAAAGNQAVQAGTTLSVHDLGLWDSFQFHTFDIAAQLIVSRALSASEVFAAYAQMRGESGF